MIHPARPRNEESSEAFSFGALLCRSENEKAPTPLSVGAFFAGGKFLPAATASS